MTPPGSRARWLSPPHRRSVPLTYEQVEAQLPPPLACDPYGADEDLWYEDEWFGRLPNYGKQQDGCTAWALDLFGPALTRLTANQAVNTLKVRPNLEGSDHDLWRQYTGVAAASKARHSATHRSLGPPLTCQLMCNCAGSAVCWCATRLAASCTAHAAYVCFR